jgi:hypothetical protein
MLFYYGLPKYLLDVIERIQKRALRIIFPDLSYEDALINNYSKYEESMVEKRRSV